MFKRSPLILVIGCLLTYSQTKAASMEVKEENKPFHQQSLHQAKTEDIKEFVDCLDKFGVREVYLQYGDDLSKIPPEKTVFLLRINGALIAYRNTMREKYSHQ